jgi:NADPH:quinone reductase-like Zn-dependent oxidoreductase
MAENQQRKRAPMRRIQYDRYGGPELLRLEEYTPEAPGKGEVLVRVLAAAANPMDWVIRKGDTRIITGRSFPRGLGHDFAGTVEAVGPGVTRFGAGDAVLGAMRMKAAGAFADNVVADENLIVQKPEALTFEEASALPTVGVTALQGLVDKGKLQSGQSVFVHGCLGGVGRMAVQVARTRGATVAGSCRPTVRQEAAALGVAPIVDFDFDPTDLEGMFDIVFDTAGTLPLRAARKLLKSGGRIIDINPSPAKMIRGALPGSFKVLVSRYTTKDLEEVAQAAGRGKLTMPVARTVSLEHAIEALKELESRHTPKGGKLVITTT